MEKGRDRSLVLESKSHTWYSWTGGTHSNQRLSVPASHTRFSWCGSSEDKARKALGLNKLGSVLRKRGKLEESSALFASAWQMDPGCLYAAFNLGSTLGELGALTRARQVLQVVVQMSPAFDEGCNALAAILLRESRNFDQVVHLCKQVLESEPTNSQACCNIGNALRRLGRTEEAIEVAWDMLSRISGVSNLKEYSSLSGMLEHCNSKQVTPKQVLVVVCVKWGVKYGSEYVNKLNRAVQRNVSTPVEFHCFTEDSAGIEDEVRCHPFPDESFFGWWNKASALFAPGLAQRLGRTDVTRVVYFDLDTVITGSLDDLFQFNGTFGTLGSRYFAASEGRGEGYNSSIIAFDATCQGLQVIYTLIQEIGLSYVSKYVHRLDYWLEMVLDDGAQILQTILPGQLVDYKTHVRDAGGYLPSNARVVNFPLLPKPHQCLAEAWVQANWR